MKFYELLHALEKIVPLSPNADVMIGMDEGGSGTGYVDVLHIDRIEEGQGGTLFLVHTLKESDVDDADE